MDIDPKDNDVYQLLKKLKQANGTYPQELLALRRQGYLKQVAEVSGGAGLAMGLKNTVRAGKGATVPPAMAGKLLESLLVVAIVAEASTLAYFYRDKINDLFQSITRSPRVEEVSSPPVVFSPLPAIQVTSTPMGTETPTETPMGTPTLLAGQPSGLPSSSASGAGNDGSGGNTGSTTVSTPDPGDNNGNQYGLTPKPERTKEPGNDTSQPDPKKHN